MKTFTLRFKTVTPLLQIENKIDSKSKSAEINKTDTKKRPFFINATRVEHPIYSANGFIGLLRREVTDIVMEAAILAGIEVDKDFISDFHYMNAGGGTGTESQPIEVREKIKDANPVVSIFGTALLVPGKIIVHDFIPTENFMNRYYEWDTENGKWYKSELIGIDGIVKNDDVADYNHYARFFTIDDVTFWTEKSKENQKERKIAKEMAKNENNGDDKDKKEVKKTDIKNLMSREYVIPGTEFISYMKFKEELTDVEFGLLLKGLKNALKKQLGSIKSKGWGVVSYNITNNDEQETLVSYPKNGNLVDIAVEETYDEDESRAIAIADEWLENIKPENIKVSMFLKKAE